MKKKNLPNGGVSLEAQTALVCAVEVLKVGELVAVIVYGNEFQRRAAMNRLEELRDTLKQEHLPLLFRVQRPPVREADCAERCRVLASQIRSRFDQKEATTKEAVA